MTLPTPEHSGDPQLQDMQFRKLRAGSKGRRATAGGWYMPLGTRTFELIPYNPMEDTDVSKKPFGGLPPQKKQE